MSYTQDINYGTYVMRQFNSRNSCSMSLGCLSQANSYTQARLNMFQLAFT